MSKANLVADAIGKTQRYLIEAIIANCFIVDLGIVTATDQATVDVQHAIQPNKYGQQLPSTVTQGVEVLWTMPGTWNIVPGDIVLLVGLKDYVKKAAGAKPSPTDIPIHYRQETMKAIPIYSTQKQAQILIDSSNLLHIKNAAASLFTILNTLIQGIQLAQCASPGSPLVDVSTKIAQASVQLSQLLGA